MDGLIALEDGRFFLGEGNVIYKKIQTTQKFMKYECIAR
jgi:hypothetical protein